MVSVDVIMRTVAVFMFRGFGGGEECVQPWRWSWPSMLTNFAC